MSDPMKVEEISDAIELLEEFDNSLPSVDKIDYFNDGIRELNNYLEDFPDSQHATFINNKKAAHTRRLLKFLSSIDSSDFPKWFDVIRTLCQLDNELDQLFEKNSELRSEYENFFSVWKTSPELKEVITALQNKINSNNAIKRME
jgi:hypothetical protein